MRSRTCSGKRPAPQRPRTNGKRRAALARRAVPVTTISIAPALAAETDKLQAPRAADAQLEGLVSQIMLDRGDSEGRLL